MTACCGNQRAELRKWPADECFSCLGNSTALMLTAGHLYEKCSPLVQGETKNDPLLPMTDKSECIVAWVGPCCDIDATGCDEDCKQHVYANAVVYKQRANWPCDEAGNPIFTVEDIEFIAQGHTCCVGFDDIQDQQKARQWLLDIEAKNTDSKGAK